MLGRVGVAPRRGEGVGGDRCEEGSHHRLPFGPRLQDHVERRLRIGEFGPVVCR